MHETKIKSRLSNISLLFFILILSPVPRGNATDNSGVRMTAKHDRVRRNGNVEMDH